MEIRNIENFKLDNLLTYRANININDHWNIIHKMEYYAEKLNNVKTSGDILVRFYDIDFDTNITDVEFFISCDKELPPNELYKYTKDIKTLGTIGREYVGIYDDLLEFFKHNAIKIPIDVVLVYEDEMIKNFILN